MVSPSVRFGQVYCLRQQVQTLDNKNEPICQSTSLHSQTLLNFYDVNGRQGSDVFDKGIGRKR